MQSFFFSFSVKWSSIPTGPLKGFRMTVDIGMY